MRRSVAGCLAPHLELAEPQEFRILVIRTAYAARATGAFMLSFATIKLARCGGAMPNEKHPFERMSILFHPQKPPRASSLCDQQKFGGDAGYCPRVHHAYYECRLSP